MKYNPPVGKTGSAAYEDGNRNAGIKGDIPPGAAVEMPQREIVNVIAYVGRTPTNEDPDQLRKSIQDLIAAETGGGDPESYVTLAMLRARLPHFPDVLTADGRINVSSPGAGLIQIPSGVTVMHRGVHPISTSDFIEDDRTFETDANRTYHCFMDLADDGTPHFVDVTDGSYNPDVLAETAATFDSTPDKALLCRVKTDVANVPTITNLANRDRLFLEASTSGPATKFTNNSNTFDAARFSGSFAVNWARTPFIHLGGVTILSGGAINVEGYLNYVSNIVRSRYAVTADVGADYYQTILGNVTGELRLLAVG